MPKLASLARSMCDRSVKQHLAIQTCEKRQRLAPYPSTTMHAAEIPVCRIQDSFSANGAAHSISPENALLSASNAAIARARITSPNSVFQNEKRSREEDL